MDNQLEKSIVITQAGQAGNVEGQVIVVDADATRHILQPGEQLEIGQKLILMDNASVDIELADGKIVPLEEASNIIETVAAEPATPPADEVLESDLLSKKKAEELDTAKNATEDAQKTGGFEAAGSQEEAVVLKHDAEANQVTPVAAYFGKVTSFFLGEKPEQNQTATIGAPADATINAADDVASAIEGQITDVSGNVLTNDDKGSTVTTIGDIQGKYGMYHFNVDGSYTYKLGANAQHISAGEAVKDPVHYTITDTAGNTATATLTTTITGTNDAPTITSIAPTTATEDGGALNGTIGTTDVDTRDTQTYTTTSTQAGFTLNPDGTYSLDTSNAAYQHLAQGDIENITIPITVTDSAGATDTKDLLITLTGTNDAPIITTITPTAGTEDGAIVSGTIATTDIDDGDSSTFSSLTPVLGFQINPDGSYTLDPSNPAYNHIAEGDTETITIPITATDSQGATTTQNLVITLTGTNDVPVMLNAPSIHVHEDDALFNGQLMTTDPDSGDVITYSATAPVHGFALNPDGSYTFDSTDPAYNHLAVGQLLNIDIPVSAADGHGGTASQTLHITILGTDDAPVMSSTPMMLVDEDHTVHGRVFATDIDDGDTFTFSTPAPTPGLTLHADGSYTFDAAQSAYQHLATGQTAEITIPVFVTDTHGLRGQGQVKIQITGTNDQPIIGGIDQAIGSVRSAVGGSVHIDGSLVITDLDDGESSFQAQLIHGKYGVLGIDAQGHWQYTADATQTALATLHGSTHVDESFTVLSADGTHHDIALKIEGENTPAIFGGVTTGMVKEDTVNEFNGKVSVMDINPGEDQVVVVDRATPHGHFTIDASGSWNFKLDNTNADVQALGEGQMLVEHVVVGSLDGTPQVITINVVGTNDAPQISGVTTGSLIEDGSAATVEGALLGTDVDTGDSLLWGVDGTNQGQYGSLVVDSATGKWTYAIDNTRAATQQLSEGQAATETFSVKARDSHGAETLQTITVTVDGTNDAPILSVTQASNIAGTLSETDVDTSDTHTFSVIAGTGSFGTLAVDPATGAYVYSQNPSVAGMNFDPATGKYSGTEVFEVRVSDNHGGVANKYITIDATATVSVPTTTTGTPTGGAPTIVVGVNPQPTAITTAPPVITPPAAGTILAANLVNNVTIDLAAKSDTGTSDSDKITSDKTPTITGTTDIPFSTVEIMEAGKVIATTTSDASGAYSVDIPAQSDGSYGLIAQATAPSSTTTVHSPVLVIDVDTTLDVLDEQVSIDEDATAVESGNVLTNDDHTNGEIATATSALKTAHGEYTLNTDGSYTFTLDTTASQSLAENETAQDTLTYTVTDPAGNTKSATLTTTIVGTNDAPILSVSQTSNIAGTLSETDVDSTDSHTFSVATGTGGFGTFSVDPSTGAYTYTQNADVSGMHLDKATGVYSATEVFEVTVDDRHGGETSKFITIDVTATIIPPAIAGGTLTIVPLVSSQPVVTDTQPPAGTATIPPVNAVTIDLAAASDSGRSHSDDVTSDTTPTITGTTDIPYSKVEIMENGKVIAVATSDAKGDYSVDLPTLSEQSHDFTAQATAPSATTSVGSSTLSVLVDTTIHASDDRDSIGEDATQVHGNVLDNDDRTHGEIAKATSSLKTAHGVYTLNTDGSYTFTVDNAASQNLAENEKVQDTLTYSVTDPAGNTKTATLTTTIIGSNDAPVVQTVDLPDTNEDTTLRFTNGELLLNSVDQEGDKSVISNVHVDAQFGKIIDHGFGHYDFVPTKNYNGDDVPIRFTVTDVHGASGDGVAHVDVNPINDKPVITRIDLGQIDEDTSKTFTEAELLAHVTDVDSPHNLLEVKNVHVDPSIGAITGDRSTGYTFTPNQDWNGKDLHINFDVSDDKGATASKFALLDVTPVQDAATIAVDSSVVEDLHVTEDTPTDSTASGRLMIIDPDAGDDQFVAVTDISGTYGSLRIIADGHWTYTINNAMASVQNLAQGESVTEVMQVQSKDGTTHTVTLIVQGTNDIPIIKSVGSVSAIEDGVQVSGQIDAQDLDSSDTLVYSLVTPVDGLHIDPSTGAYTFDPANVAYQHIAHGDTEKVSAEVIVTDPHGESVTQELLISVTGENDAMVVSNIMLASIDEDTVSKFTTSDLLKYISDPDGDTLGISHVTLKDPSMGHISQDGHGGYTFTPNHNFNGDVELDFDVTDGTINRSAEALLNVRPVNDAPVVKNINIDISTLSVTFTDAQLLARSSDVDGDNLQIDGTPTVDSKYGTIVDNHDGTYTYTISPASATNFVSAPVHFEVTDGTVSVSAVANIVEHLVSGTHKALITDISIGHITEDAPVQVAKGALQVTDPDGVAFEHFQALASHQGTYGELTLAADGTWSYALTATGNTVEALGAGDKLYDTFTVRSADGTAHELKIPIIGIDDKAVISISSATEATEDTVLSANGKLGITDVDAGEAKFIASNHIPGQHGTLSLTQDGHWTYSLANSDSAVQALGAGESLVDNINVETAGGESYVIHITVNGTNDDPVISSISAKDAYEDGALLSGTVLATDTDSSDSAFTFAVQTGATIPAGFSINSDGTYSFDPKDSAYSHMSSTDITQLRIPIAASDGHGGTDVKDLVISVHGTNTAPNADAHVDLGAIQEDEVKVFTESDLLQFAHAYDLDGDTLHIQHMQVAHGTIHDDGNGHFTFTPEADYFANDNTFTYEVTDGQASVTVSGTFNIDAVNDAPVVSSISFGTIDEDTVKHFSEQDLLSHATDVEGETVTLVGTPAVDARYGIITGDAASGFTFTPTPQFHKDNIPIHFQVTDGVVTTPVDATANINVKSIADVAVITELTTDNAVEDTQLSATGTLGVTDNDGVAQEKFQASSNIAGKYGHLELNAAGAWTYTLDYNQNVQFLAKGETYSETFSVKSVDGTEHILHVAIEGTNDAPIITAIAPTTATEDGAVLNGTILVTDADTSDTHTFTTTATPAGFTLNTDGTYSFNPADAAYQHLAKGETQTITIPVTVTDSAGGTDAKDLVITLKGTNDVPTLSVPATTSLDEDGTKTISFTVNDVDTTDTLTTAPTATHGTVTVANGQITYTPNANFNGQDTITVTTTDNNGASVTKTISVTINAVNDAPIIDPISTQTVTEDGTKTITFHATDVDTSDTLTPSVTATHGTAAINAQGEIVFTPDANYNGPATVVLSVTDGTAATNQTIDVTVTPQNDAPIITPIAITTATEDGAVLTGTILATDVDASDTQTFSTTSTQAGFTLNTDGSYSFDPSDASYQHLDQGAIETITIPVVVTDSAGLTDTKNLVITLTGTDDKPVLGGHIAGNVTEDDSSKNQASGKIDVTDVDDSDNPVFTVQDVTGIYGSVHIDATGAWTYTLDNTNPDTNALHDGEAAKDTIFIKMPDGSDQKIQISVTGTEDSPTVTSTTGQEADLGTSAEDTPVTYTQADLLQLVGASDVDTGDTLSISNVNIDANSGQFTKATNGDWTFTPAANFKGTHLPLTIEVSDGTATTTAQASLEVTPVADTPSLSVSLGSIAMTAHSGGAQTQVLDTVDATMVTDNRNGYTGDIKLDFNLKNFALASPDGLDPRLITGIMIDGVDVGANPIIVHTSLGDGVSFAGLDYDTVHNGHDFTLTFSSGAPHQMNWNFVIGMGDFRNGGTDEAMFAGMAGLNIHIDREVSGAPTAAYDSADVNEDADIPLVITTGSPDSSESLEIVVSGVPSAATLSSGTDNHDGTWTLTPAQLTGLHLTPPADFSGEIRLSVTATTTDGTDHASTSTDLRLEVTPVAETPTLTGADVTIDEDSGDAAVTIGLNLHVDPSETQSVLIEGVPAGASLSAGTKNADGSWTLTPAQLQGLSVTPEAQYSGTMALRVTATSTEQTGEHASSTLNMNVHVNPVVDMVAVSHDEHVSPVDMQAGIEVPLDISSIDSSETYTFQINVPTGWHIEDTKGVIDSALIHSSDQLANIKLFAPAGFQGDQNIGVHIIATDGGVTKDLGTINSLVSVNNHPPLITATTAHEADLGSTDEDTAKTYTEAELLHLVGASDTDSGDVLHISNVNIDAQSGQFTKEANGDWTFTPAANFKGTHLPLTIDVSDGTATTTAHANLAVTTVTDAATVGMTMSVEQEVIVTGTGGTGRIQVDNINAPADLTAFTLEFSLLGKTTTGGGYTGPVVLNLGSQTNSNLLTLWNPSDMKIGGAGNTATGINLGDGDSHRVTLSWNVHDGVLHVYDNGLLVKDIANYWKGHDIPSDIHAVVGGKMNHPATLDGFQASEHYDGQIFNTALATQELSAAQIAQAPLATTLHGSADLLFDIRSSGGHTVDTTLHLTNIAEHGLSHATVVVDTDLATPGSGSLLVLNLSTSASSDNDDPITKLEITGLIKGTVLSDGAGGHTHTITGTSDSVDVQAWTQTSLTAQLPAGVVQDMHIGVIATTTGPDGTQTTATHYEDLKLVAVPDAIITGDDDKTTDEDTAVSGVLAVTDPDASQAHFQTAPVDGKYGQLTMTADGHWTYTPNAAANALSEGDKVDDVMSVLSQDGMVHDIAIHLTGTNDAVTVTASTGHEADLGSTDEDTAKTYTEAELLHLVGASDIDTGDTLSISNVNIDAQSGHFVRQSNGDWTFTPAANFSGDDLAISIDVSDGTATTTAHATLDVAPVMDVVTVALSGDVERTTFGYTDTNTHGHIQPVDGHLHTGGDLHAFTLEVNFIYDPAVTLGNYNNLVVFTPAKADGTADVGGASLSLWTAGNNFMFTGGNIHGANTNSHINPNDGDDHRVTVVWDGATDTAKLFDNGILKVTVADFAGADHIAGDPFFNMGSKFIPGLYGGQSKFMRNYESGGFATTALSDDQVKQAPLYETLSKDPSLVLDIRGDSNGNIADHTGNHQLDTAQVLTHPTQMVSTSTTGLNPGDTIHLDLSTVATDPSDHLTKLELVGLIKGTVLTDGVNTHTVGDVTEKIDIVNWDRDHISVTLTAQNTQNMMLELTGTTTSPDGTTATDSASMPIVVFFDPAIADAVIAGDDDEITDEDTAVSGILSIRDSGVNQENFETKPVDGKYGQLTMTADGHWTYTPNALANTLSEGVKVDDIMQVVSTDGTVHEIAIHMTGANDAPIITATTGHEADLGVTAEDTPTTYTEAELLHLVGASDVDSGDTLSISNVNIDAQSGHFTKEANGDWTFTPASDFSGDDLAISIEVSDGTATTTAHATLDVTSVVDVVTVALSADVERTTFGLTSSSAHGYIKPTGDHLDTGGDLHAFTFEFSYLNDPAITIGNFENLVGFTPVKADGTADTGGGHFSMWISNGWLLFASPNVHDPDDDPDIQMNDGNDHRVTVVWDGPTDTAKVYDNGVLKVTVPGFVGADHLNADPFLNIGSKFIPGSFDGIDKFTGRLLSSSFASEALSDDQVKQASVSETLSKDHGLVMDIGSDSHGNIIDRTGHHQLDFGDLHTFAGQMVSTSSTGINPGETLSLDLSSIASSDHDDTLTKLELTGLIKGTVLSDGVHTHTVTSTSEKVDIVGWDQDHVTLTLLAQSTQNMMLELIATTTDPDGATATDTATMPIVLDVSAPIPNAIFSGDDDATTDEDTAVSGVLSVTDPDAGEAVFETTPVDGKYGQLTMTADGHWTYTPNAAANALNDGDKVDDVMQVQSKDGTTHEVAIHITGADEAAVVQVAAAAPASDTVLVAYLPDLTVADYLVVGITSQGNQVNWHDWGIKSISCMGVEASTDLTGALYFNAKEISAMFAPWAIANGNMDLPIVIEYEQQTSSGITLLFSVSVDTDGSTAAESQVVIIHPESDDPTEYVGVATNDEGDFSDDKTVLITDDDSLQSEHHTASNNDDAHSSDQADVTSTDHQDAPPVVEQTQTQVPLDIDMAAPSLDTAVPDALATAAALLGGAQAGNPDADFDLDNVASLLGANAADKAATDTASALGHAAGLLADNSDPLATTLVNLVENAAAKDPVPSDLAVQKAEDGSSDSGNQADQSPDYSDYVPPTNPVAEDDDGSGLT